MRRLFKDIHLWLSLPVGIVISVICFTGAMLVFEREITECVHRDRIFVDALSGEVLPVSGIVHSVTSALDEDVEIKSITISEDVTRAYKVNLSNPKMSLYVNQYTGEVLGEVERLPMFKTLLSLHRRLMDARPKDGGVYWGKVVVGVTTLLTVVILLTGAIIWVPRKRRTLKYRLQISLRNGWHRFWYDLHVVGGIYATLVVMAMALTGLTWSYDWYRDGLYALFGANRSVASSVRSDSVSSASEGYEAWQSALDSVRGVEPKACEYVVSDGYVSIKQSMYGNSRAADKYIFDSSGVVTDCVRYADSSQRDKLRGWIYSVHVGSWGGVVTRILWFMAAMLGATLPLTGYYLWLRRKIRHK